MRVDLQYFGGRGAGSSRGGAGGSISNKVSLPKLEGTEKQVAWAKDIRDRAVQRLHDYESGQLERYDKMARETHLRVIADGGRFLDLPKRSDFRSTEKFKGFIDRHRQSSLIQFDHADQKSNVNKHYDEISKSMMSKVKEAQGSQKKIPHEKMTALYDKFLTDRVRKQLRKQSSASWWIDHR